MFGWTELPKFRKGLEELEKPLDLWLFFLENGEKLDADALPGSLGNSAVAV
jgi:hypothetical protein